MESNTIFLHFKSHFNLEILAMILLNVSLHFSKVCFLIGKFFQCQFHKRFPLNNINFLMQMVDRNGVFKDSNTLKHEYDLQSILCFQWMQPISAIPSNWKNIIQKVTSKELYWIIITTVEHKPTSQKYSEKKFSNLSLDWKEIYMTVRIVSSNTNMRCFQYKVLSNAHFPNKKLFLFKKSNLPSCSFCKEEDETVFHLFLLSKP